MSTVGKVFVVLNLFLAGLFLGYASTALASTADYKQQFSDEQSAHTATKEELESRISDLTVELNQTKQRADSLANERDQEKARADRADSDLRAARSEVDTLTASVTGIEGSLGGLEGKLADVIASKDSAVEARSAAESERDQALDERDGALSSARAAEDMARQLENQIAQLETQLVSATGELSSAETKLKTLVAKYGSADGYLDMPAIDAAVVDVNLSLAPGLVALNKGTADGVEKGYVFDIFRNNVYKGQAVVQDVSKNVSSALIKRSIPGQVIAAGDRATTSL